MTNETKPEALALVAAESANALTVKDQPTFDLGAAKLTALAALKKDVDAKLGPFVEAAHKAHKAACAEYNKYVKPLDAAINGLKNRMLAWQEQEERKRQDEARKAQEAAEAAERKRRDDEAKAALKAAAKADAEGDLDAAAAAQEEAQAIASATVFVPSPVVAAPVKAAGVSTSKKFVAQLVDAKKWIALALASPDYAHLLDEMALVAQSEMNDRARRQGEMFNVPGWKAVEKSNLSVRG